MDLETIEMILKDLKRSKQGATKTEAGQFGEDPHDFYIPLVRSDNISENQKDFFG